jgi:hypothetical protein
MGEKSTKGLLQEHMVYQKTRTQSLADVKSLTMWGYELENIDIVADMVNAETLSFPINHISGLAPFAYCRNLKNLFLRQNEIRDLREVDYLKGLTGLTVLSLADNPICEDPNYRDTVIRKLPQLQKLDDHDVNARIPLKPRAQSDFQFEQLPHQNPPVARQPNRQPAPLPQDPSAGMKRQFNLVQPRDAGPRSARGDLEPVARLAPAGARKPTGDDSNILSAVLALIPELGVDSLQVVLRAIQERCL